MQPHEIKKFYWRLKSLRPDYVDDNDTAFAAHLDVSRGQLSRWRNGHNVPDPITVQRLAKRLRVRPAWLQYGE